jgi:type IV pilus assembly protein PilA
MKKQSGFTLIELLLVLAIIGIISAIAIPALLNQRARARDKAAVDNTYSRVAELAAQADGLRETGAAVVAGLSAYLAANAANSLDPWAGSNGIAATFPAVNMAVFAEAGNVNKAAFDVTLAAHAVVGVLGQAQYSCQVPGAADIGAVGGTVYLYGLTGNYGAVGTSHIALNSVSVE